MPLSEEELRLLEQMERALVAEDPKLASALRGSNAAAGSRRRLILAGLGFLIGVTVLMTGAILQQTVVGIIGFVAMLGTAYLGLVTFRRPVAPAAKQTEHGFGVIDGGKSDRSRGKGRNKNKSGSVSQRLEERWRRRREQNGF